MQMSNPTKRINGNLEVIAEDCWTLLEKEFPDAVLNCTDSRISFIDGNHSFFLDVTRDHYMLTTYFCHFFRYNMLSFENQSLVLQEIVEYNFVLRPERDYFVLMTKIKGKLNKNTVINLCVQIERMKALVPR